MSVKKVLFSSTLGATMAFGAITSAFAAEAPKTASTFTTKQVKMVQTSQQAKILASAKAKAIAVKKYPGAVKSIQLKKESGKYVYFVLTQGKDHKNHLVKLDARTGKILHVQHQQQQNLISVAKIKQIALKKNPGSVRSVSLAKENSKDVYTVVILSNDGVDHMVKVDARTGTILSIK